MTDYTDRSIWGAIRFRADYDEFTGKIVALSARWEGGPKVIMTDEFLKAADPKWVQRNGDYLTICQYRLHITGHDESVHYTLAERIDE